MDSADLGVSQAVSDTRGKGFLASQRGTLGGLRVVPGAGAIVSKGPL